MSRLACLAALVLLCACGGSEPLPESSGDAPPPPPECSAPSDCHHDDRCAPTSCGPNPTPVRDCAETLAPREPCVCHQGRCRMGEPEPPRAAPPPRDPPPRDPPPSDPPPRDPPQSSEPIPTPPRRDPPPRDPPQSSEPTPRPPIAEPPPRPPVSQPPVSRPPAPDRPPVSSPPVASCESDAQCFFNDLCMPTECTATPPEEQVCTESSPPPGRCVCLSNQCVMRRRETMRSGSACSAASQCGFRAADGTCEPGQTNERVSGRRDQAQPRCRCVEAGPEGSRCTSTWVEPVACRTVRDCWVESNDFGRIPIARPRRLRNHAFEACEDGEVAPACEDGFCGLGALYGC